MELGDGLGEFKNKWNKNLKLRDFYNSVEVWTKCKLYPYFILVPLTGEESGNWSEVQPFQCQGQNGWNYQS